MMQQRVMRLTCQLAHGSQVDLDPLVAVLEAKALHVRPVVVPHHAHLQLGGHLQGHPCTLPETTAQPEVILSSLLRLVSRNGLQAPCMVRCEVLGKKWTTV